MEIRPPLIQVALDFATIEESLPVAEAAVKAGCDWLEAGTPLIVAQGVKAIGAIAKAFPTMPVLADYKAMDSGGKHVLVTQQQGAHIMTVCAGAADETVKAAVKAGKETGILVCADTIGANDQVKRAKELEALGVDMIYLHFAADERRAFPSRDTVPWVAPVLEAVDIPVGVATFEIEDAVAAAKLGADHFSIGHPIVSSEHTYEKLKRYIDAVRAAHAPRRRAARV